MGLPINAANVIIVSTIFSVLATAAVGARVAARFKKALPLLWDDWTIFLALVVAVATCIMCIYGAADGAIGYPVPMLSPEAGRKLFQMGFAIILLHLTSLTFIKISVVSFYKRIFVATWFHRTANATIVFVVGWWLTFFIGLFFASTPISDYWDKHESKLNYNVSDLILVIAVLDLAVDLWILCLPIRVIFSLQMDTHRKWQLIGVFWLGAFCVVAAAVRTYYVHEVDLIASFDTDMGTFVLTNNFIWALIEPCASIFAACLPTLGPLLHGWRDVESLVRSVRSVFSIGSSNSRGSRRSGRTTEPAPTTKPTLDSHAESEEADARQAWASLQGGSQNDARVEGGEPVELQTLDPKKVHVDQTFGSTDEPAPPPSSANIA